MKSRISPLRLLIVSYKFVNSANLGTNLAASKTSPLFGLIWFA